MYWHGMVIAVTVWSLLDALKPVSLTAFKASSDDQVMLQILVFSAWLKRNVYNIVFIKLRYTLFHNEVDNQAA